jgi:multiple sugar transport system substrate-binding protein
MRRIEPGLSATLRGITWDHARGFDPLAHGARLFAQHRSGVNLIWERRSLARFGDEPLERLAQEFDLLVIDHPFCGAAAENGCLLELSPLLPPHEWERLLRDSVGPSTESYFYAGGRWALPTDAAAQVASYRPDLIERLGCEVPVRHGDVVSLGDHARRHGLNLATPLAPQDAICAFLSLLANLGAPLAEDRDSAHLDPIAADNALGVLEQLRALSHPASIDWNPIRAYETMTSSDEIAYVPLAFGYSNYARSNITKPLRFRAMAGPGPDPAAGGLLGGAGCAISAGCRDVPLAVEYLRFVHAAEHQRGAYFDAGGQPGLCSAWLDERLNQETQRFFLDTLEAMKKAHRRPRWRGFVPFMQQAGELIHRHLREGGDRRKLLEALVTGYERARSGR